jgi:hypothetical protein
MPSTKKTVKDFLFRVKPVHIVTTLIAGLGLLVFVGYKLLSVLAGINNSILIICLLGLFFLISRLSVLSSVGVGFLPLIGFGTMAVWGIWVSLIIIWVTTFIYVKIAVKPTPIDFAITKSVTNSIAQGVYLSAWSIALWILFRFVSITYVMSNLTLIYMISCGIYIVFMVILLPTLAQRPLPEAIINGLVMIPFQWILVVFFGQKFMQYLLTFA